MNLTYGNIRHGHYEPMNYKAAFTKCEQPLGKNNASQAMGLLLFDRKVRHLRQDGA